MNAVRNGLIRYLDAQGGERGRERFGLYLDASGRRTLQVTCEIDETALVRHVVQTVDSAYRPLEAYVRVAKAHEHMASGWFQFAADQVQWACFGDSGGWRLQRTTLARPARAFGSHPLAVDGWMAALFDYRGPARQPLLDAFVSSYAFDGSGVVECLPISFGLEYLGEENIAVQAGRFHCHHFHYLLDGSAIDHPPYETWVTTDGHFTLVRATVGAPLSYVYELSEYG